MIRLRGVVEYKDGRLENYEAGSMVFVAWEAYCRRQELEPYEQRNANTLNAFVAHAALEVELGFEAWMREVLDVNSEPATEAVPPTLPAPSLEPSWRSPSPPAGD